MNRWAAPLALATLIAPWNSPGLVTAQTPAESVDPRTMRFEPVEFHPPEPERLVLDNGMVVYLLEDHELPLVTITATIQTGGWLDPQDKIGLAELTGIVMRTGGTQRMTPEQVDEELDRVAAFISVDIGVESGSAMLDVLKKDLDRGLQIFADILRAPAFESGRVELAKLQAIEEIRRRQDQPGSIAGREFAKLLYGPTHPYARESTVESVSRITRKDLAAFHARTVHPNGIILGVTGDFEKSDLLARLRHVFGSWNPGKVQPIVLQPAADGAEREGTEGKPSRKVVRLVVKETTQTHLRVGHLSIKENDPDYPALTILNDILGGGSFRSRLFKDIRSQAGWAYSVGSRLLTGVRAQGAWYMSAETKLTSTRDVIDRLMADLTRLQEQPVTDKELEEAKEAFVNSFVFSFASPSSIVSRLIELEYDGLPKDFLQQLRDKVVKLTKEDMLAAARRHLHPNRLRILAVGPPERLAQPLAAFGEVEEVRLPPEG